MYRPDWLISVKSWKNYPQLAYPFDADIVQTLLPAQKLDDFYDSGYLVLSNIVSNECVSAAYRLALYGASHDAASVHLSPYGHTELRGSFASDSEILALYYSSYLVHVIQYLLGPNDVQLPVKARVSLSYPSLSNTLFSTDSSSALAGSNWLIDGLTGPGTHSSSYTVLVGVALTDMSVPFSGNRCVFPRSHSELQSKCAQQVTSKSKVFSHPWSTPGKPSLMNPTQLLLQAGDVFLCHSRLAYLEAPNTSLNQIHGNVSHILISNYSRILLNTFLLSC